MADGGTWMTKNDNGADDDGTGDGCTDNSDADGLMP